MKIIELKNVNKKFILHNQKGTVLNVLKNINLEIKTGECIALVGKSGIGKSTFLKMLYGNYLPSSGEINIYNNSKPAINGLLGTGCAEYVFQKK